jgi:phosphoribosylglycinamide formyltransferase-1
MKYRIAIFASGSGSNAEEIMKFFQGHPRISVAALLSNNAGAYALERAKKYGVPTRAFNREEFTEGVVIPEWLARHEITHIVLAGFLWLIPSYLVKAYPDRIINIHPALLPLFGGKGMYGMKVHQAVKDAGSAETGITIHLVNDRYDEGRVIFQGRCSVDVNSSPEEIAKRVHALEYEHYPRVIEKWILENS